MKELSDYMNGEPNELLSNCCGARPLGELCGDSGRCSRCQEGAVFSAEIDEE